MAERLDERSLRRIGPRPKSRRPNRLAHPPRAMPCDLGLTHSFHYNHVATNFCDALSSARGSRRPRPKPSE
jgi:hypothetical protein